MSNAAAVQMKGRVNMNTKNVTPVIKTVGLKKYYKNRKTKETVRAVDDVDIVIEAGQAVGIVGESGCGKSTIAKLLMRLEEVDKGEIYFLGQRIDNLSERKLKKIRGQFQMVFQDSSSSLNPRKRIIDILSVAMLHHGVVKKDALKARLEELMELVGLPKDALYRYPHEFSGGQRQRICIARALSLNPKLLILDEPVSALDVSVQAQILNLLKDLQKKLGITSLFIGHGLSAVRYVSDVIAVMYKGKIVEYGDAKEVFECPAHPYTKALLDATPMANPSLRDRDRIMLAGEVRQDSLVDKNMEHPCAFWNRCPYATTDCERSGLEMVAVEGKASHYSRCSVAYAMCDGKGGGCL